HGTSSRRGRRAGRSPGADSICPPSGADCRHERCDEAGPATAGAAAVAVGVDRAGAGGGGGRGRAGGAGGCGRVAAGGRQGRAAELGVTTRTVRRDVDRLRQMGYPVLTSAGHGGGYQLGAGRALPPLLLSSSEAVAVAVGLRLAASSGIDGLDEEALRALAALDRILPAQVRAEVGAVSGAMGVITRAAPGARSEVLMSLASAVRDGVRVRVDYERADGERFERRLEPYRVLSVEGRWYLFAWDLAREDWRTFRLDRMHE